MKFRIAIIILVIFSFLPALSVSAAPYENYLYSHSGTPRREPQAYIPDNVINGGRYGIGSFKDPADIFAGNDNNLYIADTGNNRIVVLDGQLKLKRVITEFMVKGKSDRFNSPKGLYVRNSFLFVADFGNNRIVKIDLNDLTAVIFLKPKIDIQENVDFIPSKIAVDSAYRMYVVSANTDKGILELDSKGEFISFFGAIKVIPSFIDIFWRRFMTDEQIKRSVSIVPTEYNNVCIDDQDFVYGTISALDSKQLYNAIIANDSSGSLTPVRKLNPLGADILRKLGFYPPYGDVDAMRIDDAFVPSKLVDVCVGENGLYSVLDSLTGRVFTYDNDGNLLFVFGAISDNYGGVGSADAVDRSVDGRYYVLDTKYNQVIEYVPTEYAKLILTATNYYFNMEYDKAEKIWLEAIQYTSSSDLAYVGMGKSQLRLGNYEQALTYFKLGHSQDLFSKAYSGYRDNFFNRYFNIIVICLVIIILAFIIFKIKKRHDKKLRSI